MIVTVLTEESNLLVTKDIYFNDLDKEKYQEQFEKMKQEGVFRYDIEFEDNKWVVIANDIEYRVNLTCDELMLKRKLKSAEIEMTIEDFFLGVKAYTLNALLNNAPKSVGYEISRLYKIIETIGIFEDGKVSEFKKLIKHATDVKHCGGAITILEFMGIPIQEKYIDTWYEMADSFEEKSKSRKLPDFKDIFEFGSIIKRYTDNATEEDILKYGVVVLWWQICNRVPLRPTEFVLLPRNCAFEDNGKYYLNLKRNNGKGSTNSKRKQVVGEDGSINTYEEDTIRISVELFNLINRYKDIVDKNYPERDDNFLIDKKFYDEKVLERTFRKQVNANRFTSYNLRNMIYSFYEDVVVGKYNRKFWSKNEKKKHIESMKHNKEYKSKYKGEYDDFMEMIVPYDLRHVAIINLILMGCEPLTVMKMAGHKKIKTTRGYFDHVDEYGRSYIRTYSKYLSEQKYNKTDALSDDKIINLENLIDETTDESAITTWRNLDKDNDMQKVMYKKVDGGICRYLGDDFTPCFMVEGRHSRCPYFMADNKTDLNEEFYAQTRSIDAVLNTIKYLVDNYDKIVDFSRKYSVAIESYRSGLDNASIIASKMKKNEEDKNEE